MANWSPFRVRFHGDDLLLSRLFQHWRQVAENNEPGSELTRLDNPLADGQEPALGAIFHLEFDERLHCLRGVGKWQPPLAWLQSLTASAPLVCALDYRNPDDNVDHFVLIVANEIHELYSVENELADDIEIRIPGRKEAVIPLARPEESRALRHDDDDEEE